MYSFWHRWWPWVDNISASRNIRPQLTAWQWRLHLYDRHNASFQRTEITLYTSTNEYQPNYGWHIFKIWDRPTKLLVTQHEDDKVCHWTRLCAYLTFCLYITVEYIQASVNSCLLRPLITVNKLFDFHDVVFGRAYGVYIMPQGANSLLLFYVYTVSIINMMTWGGNSHWPYEFWVISKAWNVIQLRNIRNF